MIINNILRNKIAIVLLTAPLVVAGGNVLAQDAESDDSMVLEEVIVTAQKMEQREQEVPISIKTIGSDVLEMINAERFEDMGRLVPSLSFTDRQRGQNQVLIRGLGTVNGVSTVAVYNDGVVAANRIGSNGSFGEIDPSFYDIDRVEVLRGPQGTLYGEGSFGGVINIISKRPDASGFDGSASVTWRDVKEGSSSNYDYAAMLNIPLTDKLAFRMVGSYVDHDGFVEKIDTISFAETKNINTEETTSWRAMLGYSGEMFTADLMYKYQEIKLGGSNSVMPEMAKVVEAALGLETDEYYQFSAGDSNSSFETKEFVLDMNWDFDSMVLTSLTSSADQDSLSRVTIPGFETSPLVNTFDAWSQEFRLASVGGENFDWIVGAYFRDTDRSVLTAGIALDVTQKSKSLFGQAYWYINEAFTATFGLRWEDIKATQRSVFDDFLLDQTAKGDWSEISPKFTLDWKVQEDLMFYGTIAKGFRTGGLNIDFASALGLPPELLQPIEPYNEAFDPDYVWNYELGMKSSWLDGRLTWNLAVFYIDWQDYQTEGDLFLGANGIGYTVNSGNATSVGIESDLLFIPAEGWLLTLGASHVDPTLKSGAFKGNQLANAPENLFNASVEYSWPIGSWEAYVYGGYSWRDESYGDVINGDDPTVPPAGLNRSDAYAIGNLRAGLRNDHWSVQAFVENVGNEYGSSFRFQVGEGFDFLTGAGYESISLITPRTYGINVSYHF